MGLTAFTAVMTYLRIGGIDVLEILRVLFMISIFVMIFVVMQRLVPWLVERIEHLNVEQAEFSFAFIFMIFVALLAEQFGLHGIVGAFLAGTLLADSQIGKSDFIAKLSSISYAIFIPLFFVWTGLLLNLGDITFMSFVLVFAVLAANAVAAYWASRMNGLNTRDCLMTAITMLPRGDINLVIASIGVLLVDINGKLVLPTELGKLFYSTAMLLVILAALITFVGLKIFIKGDKNGFDYKVT
jgi:Kef-type K+ transport system membrane component KefB